MINNPNITTSEVYGICAGCKKAIGEAQKLLQNGKSVTFNLKYFF